jgi:pimeloyl-ACP methyl ester carboxylesterase
MRLASLPTGDGFLSVATAGGPSPNRLLLVHGFTGAKEDFTEWLEPLAAIGWEGAAVDLRGHGASLKPEGLGHYGFEVMAGDVLAVADGLGWDRFTLLGHSMGGMVAQLVALSPNGSRLTGLVLMDTGHGPVERIERQVAEMACAIVAAGGMPALVEAAIALRRDGHAPLATAAQERVLAERPGHEEFNLRKLLATAPDAYRSMAMAAFDQPDRLEALRHLDLPVLVVVGEQDVPFVEPSRRMAAAIPGAVGEVIPDAGHSPQFENPDAWWAVLARFLHGLSATEEDEGR